jgi:hypothetical protein
MVRKVNSLACTFTGSSVTEMIGSRGGEALRCLYAPDSPEGCGFGPHCRQCTVRLLLLFYDVRSERELVDTLPERIDWLWFLGYDIDSVIPNHSLLSKARGKWGVDVFSSLFERTVLQCVAYSGVSHLRHTEHHRY